jgi:hypothetical protein
MLWKRTSVVLFQGPRLLRPLPQLRFGRYAWTIFEFPAKTAESPTENPLLASFQTRMDRLNIVADGFKRWGSDSVWPDISPTTLLWSAAGGFLLYLLIFGLFLSPTRNIPGPVVTRFSSAWFLYRILRGYFASDVVDLHRKYGTPTQLDASAN